MPGYHAVIVGYRKDDRRRYKIADEHGVDSVLVGKCVSCGYPVWFVKSGQDAYMSRDPAVVCRECGELHHADILKAL